MTTPTAALVEEAEKMAVRALDGTASREEKSALFAILAAALRRAEAEREEARRDAEAYKRQTQEVSAKAIELTKEVCAKLDHAIAERDELRATVTRLNRRAQTAEAGVRDNVEASKAAGKTMGRTLANAAAAMYQRRAEKAEAERDAQHAEVLRLTGERDALAKDLTRIRAVSAIAGSVARWDSLLNEMHKQKAKVSELTATRDLLNEENARLQARVATLELLLRGRK